MDFNFILPQKIIFGEGAATRIGEKAKTLGAKRVVIVTSQGMLKREALKQVINSLKEHKLSFSIFSEVNPEPSIEKVSECIALAEGTESELLVGLGGGSVMDVAKKAATDLKLPKIMIPTTAGTGSEVTHEVVLKVGGEKKAFVDERLVPDIAIVDPGLTMTMPPRLTASSGIDALAHAIECYDSRKSNPLVKALAWYAYTTIRDNLIKAVHNQGEGRVNMALGSLAAGIAFGNSGTSLCHAMSYPLSNEGIPHGEAVATMLPAVLEFNNFDVEIARQIRELLLRLNMMAKFRSDIRYMAEVVMKDSHHLDNNPRKVSFDDVVAIYRKVQEEQK
jgi:alcohol dehydrogenase class IV